MKNTKQCLKCESKDVVVVEPFREGAIRTDGVLNYARLSRYACLSCGFSEEWVADAQNLSKVRESYERHLKK
jgi:hypothetical protein